MAGAAQGRDAGGGRELPDPQDWMPGKPGARADLRPEVPVLLLHGTADPVVPVSFTEQFAAALDGGGHELTTQYLEGGRPRHGLQR